MNQSSKAILAIYDAAMDDSKWQDALESSLSFIGAPSASIHVIDVSNEQPWVMNCRGGTLAKWSPDELKYFAENLARYEIEAWEVLQLAPIRTPLEDIEIWPDIQTIRQRADYKYLEQTTGLFRRFVARLNDNARWYDAIAVQFDAATTIVPTQTKKAAQLLFPHMGKSIEMSRTYRELLKRYSAVLSALDNVQIGICLVLSSAEVVVSNLEAKEILESKAGIRLDPKNRLACRDFAAQAELAHAIVSASATAKGEGNMAEHILVIPRGTQDSLLVEVSPIRDSLLEIDRGLYGAIVTLIDPTTPRPFDDHKVAMVFGLSSAERDVCRMVVDGRSNGDIADERCVSIETIKTQVVSVFRKTNLSSRADLIRLVLKTCPPIRNNSGDAD